MRKSKKLFLLIILCLGVTIPAFGAGESYHSCPIASSIQWNDMTPNKGKNKEHLWSLIIPIPGGFIPDITDVRSMQPPTFSVQVSVYIEASSGAGTPDLMTCVYTPANIQTNPMYEASSLQPPTLITSWAIQRQLRESDCVVDTKSTKGRVRCP